MKDCSVAPSTLSAEGSADAQRGEFLSHDWFAEHFVRDLRYVSERLRWEADFLDGKAALLHDQMLLAFEQSAWRPIETAPKDGTRILVMQTTPGDYENVFTGARWVEYRGAPDGGVWSTDLGGLWPDLWAVAPPRSSERSTSTEGRRDTPESTGEPA
jgi:hypothetical protein